MLSQTMHHTHYAGRALQLACFCDTYCTHSHVIRQLRLVHNLAKSQGARDPVPHMGIFTSSAQLGPTSDPHVLKTPIKDPHATHMRDISYFIRRLSLQSTL